MLTVVTGPPCVGKSTYVEANASGTDVIIDLDRLALGLTVTGTTSHDYAGHVRQVARCARNAAIDASVIVHKRGIRVWIIDSAPSRAQRAWYHRQGAVFVRLTETPSVLAQRLAARPESNQRYIRSIPMQNGH